EVVHCYQFDARGTCPGGLIEGMAGAQKRLHMVWLIRLNPRMQILSDSTPLSPLHTGSVLFQMVLKLGTRDTRRRLTFWIGSILVMGLAQFGLSMQCYETKSIIDGSFGNSQVVH